MQNPLWLKKKRKTKLQLWKIQIDLWLPLKLEQRKKVKSVKENVGALLRVEIIILRRV